MQPKFNGNINLLQPGEIIPKISIVTSVLNAKDNIEMTIQSVLSQTYLCIEYIVIDGGSTDGTNKIIERYSHQISHYLSESDDGIYDAMNKGVALATGDWIIFMNAGDVFHCSTTLADLICLAPEDPDVIYGDVSIMYRNFVRVQKAMPLSTSWMGIPFSHQSMLTRTRLLRAHKFDIGLRYCADYELVCFLLAAKLRFFYSNQTVSRVSAYGFCDTNRVAVLTEMSHIAKLYFPGILTLLHFTSMVIKEKALGLLKYLIPRKLLELATKIKHWNGNNVLRDWKSLNE